MPLAASRNIIHDDLKRINALIEERIRPTFSGEVEIEDGEITAAATKLYRYCVNNEERIGQLKTTAEIFGYAVTWIDDPQNQGDVLMAYLDTPYGSVTLHVNSTAFAEIADVMRDVLPMANAYFEAEKAGDEEEKTKIKKQFKAYQRPAWLKTLLVPYYVVKLVFKKVHRSIHGREE